MQKLSRSSSRKKERFRDKYLLSHDLPVLAKMSSYKMRYKLVQQTLDIIKANRIILKIIIRLYSH